MRYNTKKTLIFVLAIAAIVLALWSVWSWVGSADEQPTRQENEIR
ncbi:MAG: hypothetical protein WCI57_01860 [Candidatus Berkelbacteria bacterium]